MLDVYNHIVLELSTHDLTRRSTESPARYYSGRISFNSRPHKEVDPVCYYIITERKSFNSRPHKEVDIIQTECLQDDGAFNSRPHKEVDLGLRFCHALNASFNSRPHKEVDLCDPLHLRRHNLSTHDLTRRSTGPSLLQQGYQMLFQLTTSQGGRLSPEYSAKISSTFQLTTSQGGRPLPIPDKIYPAVFQLTTSQGGRLKRFHIKGSVIFLSTHDLTRRSTLRPPRRLVGSCIFQLTTSQGGRREGDNKAWIRGSLSTHDLTRRSTTVFERISFMKRSFNSRPHKEVDLASAKVRVYSVLSTHDLTRRSTRGKHKDGEYRITFQLTTSQGGRQQISTIIANICIHYSLFFYKPIFFT